MTIVGIIIFYSFLSWGLSELYQDRTIDKITAWELTDPNDEEPYNSSVEVATGLGGVYNGIYQLIKMILAAVTNVFHIATFTDPRIPFLVNLVVIAPLNITLILSILSIPFGSR
ncbi:MAG: hypothetical protein OIN84_00880 [Candidatus Methanoperedens sp.]|nr:MAG: hypothetical protein F9K14_03190 [Candidatus Methanoperedens sp.]MBZ0175235.1 hypothetical protein [Candidatus Methanoperedens nitroreducens]MCX9076507.1 hypothetical protein [Candidatus Methanoperedens sp.]